MQSVLQAIPLATLGTARERKERTQTCFELFPATATGKRRLICCPLVMQPGPREARLRLLYAQGGAVLTEAEPRAFQENRGEAQGQRRLDQRFRP
eukprot:1690805-Alexandrium_andersonii.AAC.1